MKSRKILLLFFVCAVVFAGGCTGNDTLSGMEVNTERQDDKVQIFSYESQEMYAQRGKNQIYGIIYIHENSGEEMPAVIFSHGFGGDYQAGIPYAEALARRGYVVYCFDFCGGSPGSRSDGSALEMSIETEKADLEAVIHRIQGLDYVDSEKIFLMGTSQGGVVSAITGADHEEVICGMILLYPAFILVDRANDLFQNAEDNARPEITVDLDSIEEYDTIFIGYPIWWDEAPMVIDTFLESYDFSGKTIVPFCTSASDSIENSLHIFTELAPDASIAEALTANDESEIEPWLAGLGF